MRRNAFLAGVFTSAAMAVIALSGAQTYRYPFQNPGLSLEQRVEDLVTRLSPDEKIAQLQHNSPAVSRLGIPAHFWKHDPAKGSARAGTVFPQPIGLAASFNPELAMEVAGALSDELRAKNNDAVRRGVRDAQTNLTLWLPEPNVLRDPRWGGGQNSFGEDPFLASRFAVAYAKGIQGTDPDFLKVLAAPRGFAPFSGPGSGVARFNAGVSRHDLHSSYLPAFEALVREARPWAVVSAPNRVNGLAAAATPYLLEDMLRERWGFRGVVISDCGGQGRSPEEIAKAVRAGTDLDCAVCNRALVEARKKGLVTEEQIEASLRRAFAARFKLGQFDPGGSVIHSKIALSVVDSPRHRRLALEAARQSIVLLKNDNGVLPLKKSSTVAVIGPNADDVDVLLGSSQETPTYAVTPLEGIRGLVNSSTRVLYAKGTEATEAANLLAIPSSVLISGDEKGARGLRGEYFNNKDLRGEPVLRRIDRQINFDWAEGSPAPAVNEDQFSARWRGKLMPPVSGEYLLGLSSDDGMSLYINGKRIIDDWDRQGTATKTASMRLEKGQTYDVLVEYREITGSAVAKLVWAPPNAQNYGDAVEVARQADVVVAVMGLNSSLENDSSDRSSLDLPKAQLGLLQSLHATGKPVVLVLINGGTLSLGWAEANVAAIVETWYPGVEGGNAIAQVLYGDYNPGGKLPVTFYRSLDQVPDFASYSMRGRTYRFATERPLYPFGYGLSYTTFRYSNLVVPASAKLGSEVALKVTVENAGNRAGSEVVQVYATRTDSQIQGAPLRELQAFKRVFLRPGEKRDLGFTLRPSQLSSFDKNGERLYEAATYRISVGNGQPNANNGTSYRPGEGGYRTLKIVR